MPSAAKVFDTVLEHRDPAVTAPEVAKLLDCSRREALNTLTTLAEIGELETKKVGARGRIFWIPSEGRSKEPLTVPSTESSTEASTVPTTVGDGQLQEKETESGVSESIPSSEPLKEPSTEPLSDLSVDDVFDRISRAEWEDAFHHRGYTEERIETVKLAYEYIREEGEGQRSGLHEQIFSESQADFSDSEQLWDKVVAKGLGLIAEHDACLLRPSGGRRWWAYSPIEEGDSE
jgi:hypothetical protein